MAYEVTVWVNNTAPALSAANLNKLTDELEAQASEVGLAHSLPTWVNNSTPALTDPGPLNEMERILETVADNQGLMYNPTVWEAGWMPGRNAYRFNKMEAQAAANRDALDADPGNLLAWASPTAQGLMGAGGVEIVEFTLTDATRNSSTLGNGLGRDIRVIQTGVVSSGAVAQFNNWRHVEWIGGDINIPTAAGVIMALPMRNATGVVHLEGVWIHGNAVNDGFVMRSAETTEGMTVQLQNCRIEAHESGSEHADCTQFQNAKIDAFRVDKCTLQSTFQGMFMRVGSSASDYAKNIDLSRLNFRGNGKNQFWQTWETSDAMNGTELKAITPITLDDVWIAPDGSAEANIGTRVVPNRLFYDGLAGGPNNSQRGCYVTTDATGQLCTFSSGVVGQTNPLGEQTKNCFISGVIRYGIPPAGDFVPGVAGTGLGINYVSPGYA